VAESPKSSLAFDLPNDLFGNIVRRGVSVKSIGGEKYFH